MHGDGPLACFWLAQNGCGGRRPLTRESSSQETRETKLVKVQRGQALLGALAFVLFLGAFAPRYVSATDVDMWSLPSYEPARCQSCHQSSELQLKNDPSLASQLNPFGVDWKNGGRVWGPSIAKLDSDGDQCLNGAELGDYAGTEWTGPNVEDPNRKSQNSNPGVVDCSLAEINDRSWGILKAVFGESNKFKVR